MKKKGKEHEKLLVNDDENSFQDNKEVSACYYLHINV